MAKAHKRKQLSFSMPNRIGLLSELASFLTAARINIEAIGAYGVGDEGRFMLMTDNNGKAKKVISQMGAEVKTEDVITIEVPNKAGQLQQVAKKLSDAGLDIFYVYAGPGKSAMNLILKTADDKKALKVLNK
jgi:hypothetical protein